MKKIIILFLFIYLFSFPVQAISGYVSLDYDTINGTNQGIIYVEKNINNFHFGMKLTTDIVCWGLKDGYFPAGVPESQTYDLIVDYKVTDDITVSFIEGCKHYFAQSKYNSWNDESYIKIKTKYEF